MKKEVISIEAFKTSDGKIFSNIKSANSHQIRLNIIQKLRNTGFSLDNKVEISDLDDITLSIIIDLAEIING